MTARPYADIETLIERSSLGTPKAKALRASVPDEAARLVVQQSDAFGRLMQFGFPEEQAWTLARAGYTVFFVPAERLLGGAR